MVTALRDFVVLVFDERIAIAEAVRVTTQRRKVHVRDARRSASLYLHEKRISIDLYVKTVFKSAKSRRTKGVIYGEYANRVTQAIKTTNSVHTQYG